MREMKFGEESVGLTNEQLARGYILLNRVEEAIDRLRENARKTIQDKILTDESLSKKDVGFYNIFSGVESVVPGLQEISDELTFERNILFLDLDVCFDQENPFDLSNVRSMYGHPVFPDN